MYTLEFYYAKKTFGSRTVFFILQEYLLHGVKEGVHTAHARGVLPCISVTYMIEEAEVVWVSEEVKRVYF